MSSLFGDELIMGSFIVRFLPILLGLILLTENDTTKKKSTFFHFIFSSYLIFISGERLAFVYLIIIFLIFFLFLSFEKFFKFGILVTIIFSIIVS